MKELLKFIEENKIIDLMNRRRSAIIVYRNDADGGEMLTRVISIYALGTTFANNPAILVFQEGGGSVSGKNYGWKIMRLDRIVQLMEYGQMRENAPSDYNPNGVNNFKTVKYQLPSYNPPIQSEEEIREQVKITQPTNTLAEWIKRWKEQRKNKKNK